MATSPVPTREKLIEAATRLFADRGAFDVPLSEVVREAGQRNASAVHYHFGSRDQVLVAILEPMIAALRERRRELTVRLATMPTGDVRAVVEVIVRPLVEQAAKGELERAAMQIGMELGYRSDRTPPEINRLLAEGGGTEALDLLGGRLPAVPPDVWALRRNLVIQLVSRAATDRARLHDHDRSIVPGPLDDERFVQRLIDVVVGMISAPSTEVAERS